MGIDTADLPESRRQVNYQMNKEKEAKSKEDLDEKQKKEEAETAQRKKEAREFMESGDIPTNEQNKDSDNNFEPLDNKPAPGQRNTKAIPNIALASMRHHTGLRETAEIATATLIDFGIVTDEDSRLVIDHNKVKRAQETLAAEIRQDFEEEIKKNGVSCIFFDGRQDETKVMMEWEDGGKQFPGLRKEEHYSVCQEPGGRYLFHFVPNESTPEKKHS